MHGYYWSLDRLNNLLPEFFNGHFLVYKKGDGGHTLRGETEKIEIPKDTSQKILITFKWVVFKRMGCTKHFQPVVQWERIEDCSLQIDFSFLTYYSQRPRLEGKGHRHKRLKLKGWGGEFCRLYLPSDPFSEPLEKILSVGHQA